MSPLLQDESIAPMLAATRPLRMHWRSSGNLESFPQRYTVTTVTTILSGSP